jgi:hypothetical protein
MRGKLYPLFRGFRGCGGYDKGLLGNNKEKLSRRSAVIREIRGRLYPLFRGFRGCSGYDKGLPGNNTEESSRISARTLL